MLFDIPEEEYEGNNYDIGKSRHIVDDWIIEELKYLDENIYVENDFASTLDEYPVDFIHFYTCLQIMRKARLPKIIGDENENR